MGRFTPRYSDAQKTATLAYILDQGHSAPAAVRAAADGRLGIEPFDLNLKTARYWTRREKERRAIEAVGPLAHMRSHDACEQLRLRLVKVADRLTTEMVRQGPKAQPRQAIEVAKLIQELGKIHAPNDPPPTKARGGARDDAEASSGPSFLDQLAAATQPEHEPPSQNPTQDRTGDGNATTAPTPPHAETTAATRGNGVSAAASARRAALTRAGQQLG